MSHPFFGEEFTFTQPDGAKIRVRGWGDQNRARFETLDGFTLVKNLATGFYEFAALSNDGERLLPTGVLPNVDDPQALGLPPQLHVGHAAFMAEGESNGLLKPRWMRRLEQQKAQLHAAAANFDVLPAPPARHTVGDFVGLCLLIQFPDVPGTVSQAEISSYCNQIGYSGFGNNGSVHDYFFDVSGGKLRYTTIVAPYYTSLHSRSYYTDPNISYGVRARELVLEALNFHLSQGFDFSTLSIDSGSFVYATNVFYAGEVVNNWSQGLWPHASRLATPLNLGSGRLGGDYQVTALTTSPTLGTYCHENGHMLCDFPDLYDYGSESAGIGNWCLMCAGNHANQRNPTHVGAYLKFRAGWANSVTRLTSGSTYVATAGANQFFLYEKNSREYFIVENRHRSARDIDLPGSGLAIWHVDELGSNNNEQMTPLSHYECSLAQADGRFDLERTTSRGDSSDLFPTTTNNRFGDGTTPHSKWWDGSSSGLDVFNISASGPSITFSVNLGSSSSTQRLPLAADLGAINPNASFPVTLANATSQALRLKTVRFSSQEPQVFSIDLSAGMTSGAVTFFGGGVRGVAGWSTATGSLVALRAVPMYQSQFVAVSLEPGLPVANDIGMVNPNLSFQVRFRNATARALRMKTVRFSNNDPTTFVVDLNPGTSSPIGQFFGGSTRMLAVWTQSNGVLIHLQALPLYQNVQITYRELSEVLGNGTQVTVPLVTLEPLI